MKNDLILRSVFFNDATTQTLRTLVELLQERGVPDEKCEQICADIYRALDNPAATVPVRVWVLGDVDKRFIPSEAAIAKLVKFIETWDGQGDLDVVWGPCLKMHRVAVTPEDLDVVCSASSVPAQLVEKGT